MLIINADDFGRSRLATDRILACHKQGSVTSASAMVFMADSLRAAELAREFGLDVGLHLNFTQRTPGRVDNELFLDYHEQLVRYLALNKFSFLIYNPALRNQFNYVFRAQYEEFERIFGVPPSHFDGHHHMHLCANMVLGRIMPKGHKIRRNFSFARGEKNFVNRAFRSITDKILSKRYVMPDYLFSLSERLKSDRLAQALELAKLSNVELQAHPEKGDEFRWLSGQYCKQSFSGLQKGGYSQLRAVFEPINNKRIRQKKK
jgi:predicted glycoside hydrolase/deacetylase ChbG (UPF0249 family)